MSTPGIVVFGVASDASVDQWDGHRAPRGILLRWFLPDFDFPQFGFDVYRASIPDIPPLPFDDINTAAVSGTPSWEYAGIVTLSCASGLTFQPTTLAGWNALVITPNAPVRVRFNGTAWRIQVSAAPIGAGIEAVALVDGVETLRETLDQPNAQLLWRARHVGEIVLRGEGTVSFIGFHLLDDSRFWTHIGHRCLPVHDAAYPCAPHGAATEEDEAVKRLPSSVAADWTTRFAGPFNTMLPALRRLARGETPAAIPPDSLDPRHPTLTTDSGSGERALIRIALLDPHVARILGLAYDDPLVLNGQEFAYKVTGLWRGAQHEVDGTGLKLADFFKQLGKAGARVKYSARDSGAAINLPGTVVDFVLDTEGTSTLEWSAQDEFGNESTGVVDRKHRTLTLPRVATLRLRWTTGSDPVFMRASWFKADRRTGILPSVYARDPGAPAGPASIDATVELPASPSGLARAVLDWPLPVGDDSATLEGDVVAYQVGHRLLGASTLLNAPATGPAAAADVLRPFSPIYLSMQSIADTPPRRLHLDYNDGRGLGPGWWGWWVRGVDLFGRVSPASSWDTARIEDTAPPPAPVLVQAEWVQRALPAMTVAVMGRSVEAQRWLTASEGELPQPVAGLVAAWAMPPEQAAVRDDVDGFRLFLRKAAPRPGAAQGAPLEYQPWSAHIAQFGPLQIVGRGSIVSVTPDPELAVTLSAGESVPEGPRSPTAPLNPPLPRIAYRTNLALDGASNLFVGGALTIGTRVLTVVANGDGPNLIVVVEHPTGSPPPLAGAATLRAAADNLVSFETDVPDLASAPGLSVRSGLLLDEQATPARFPVLRKIGDEILCAKPPDPPDVPTVAPAPGHVIAWHPVWFASLSDSGFGPVANATTPVANAQVAVQAVRLLQTQGLTSARSATLTVTAVDVAAPPTPTITAIPFDPEGTCVELASRADWYGDSRFTFSWTPQTDCTFTVYRALADEVFRLDRVHARRSATRSLAQSHWPPGVFADAARKARVESELATIDTALASTAAAAPDDQNAIDLVDAAYADACNDTQMFLGLQPHTWAAFTPCFGRPIETSSYTDTLNGRTRAHWFYAVTARSLAGVESPPSTISPPICCPDVVPPAAPLAHTALAAEGAVKLKWLASPDADTHHYEIYAAREPDAVAKLDTLTPVTSYAMENGVATALSTNYTPNPHVSGKTIERFVPRAHNEMGEWCFWIIATDTAGNRSEPSRMLRGKALQPPPLPPRWVSAQRVPAGNASRIELRWRHDQDQRLSCSVERRSASGGYWGTIAPWLPRGVYSFDDTPPDISVAWEYRLQVRDHLDQHANARPSIAVPGL
jgi:hypothetical protein